MTVDELQRILAYMNPESEVVLQDGYHFMRFSEIERVDEGIDTVDSQYSKVVLVGKDHGMEQR